MAFTLTEVLSLVIMALLLLMAGRLMLMAGQVSKAAGELRDAIQELRPELRRLVCEAEGALADVRKTSDRIGRIAGTVEEGTTLAREMLTPVSMRLVALVAAVKVGFGALRRRSSRHDNGTVVADGGME